MFCMSPKAPAAVDEPKSSPQQQQQQQQQQEREPQQRPRRPFTTRIWKWTFVAFAVISSLLLLARPPPFVAYNGSRNQLDRAMSQAGFPITRADLREATDALEKTLTRILLEAQSQHQRQQADTCAGEEGAAREGLLHRLGIEAGGDSKRIAKRAPLFGLPNPLGGGDGAKGGGAGAGAGGGLAGALGGALGGLGNLSSGAIGAIFSGIEAQAQPAANALGAGVGTGAVKGLNVGKPGAAAKAEKNQTGVNGLAFQLGEGLSSSVVSQLDISSLTSGTNLGGAAAALGAGLGNGTAAGLKLGKVAPAPDPNATGVAGLGGQLGFGLTNGLFSNVDLASLTASAQGSGMMSTLAQIPGPAGRGLGRGAAPWRSVNSLPSQLKEHNLKETNLKETNLKETNLKETNLKETNLKETNLRKELNPKEPSQLSQRQTDSSQLPLPAQSPKSAKTGQQPGQPGTALARRQAPGQAPPPPAPPAAQAPSANSITEDFTRALSSSFISTSNITGIVKDFIASGGGKILGPATVGLAKGLGSGTAIGLGLQNDVAAPPPTGFDIPGISNGFGKSLTTGFLANGTTSRLINIFSAAASQGQMMLGAAAEGLGKGFGGGTASALGLSSSAEPSLQGASDIPTVLQAFSRSLTTSFLANGTVGRLESVAGELAGGMMSGMSFEKIATGLGVGLIDGGSSAISMTTGIGDPSAMMASSAAYNDTVGGASTGFGRGLGFEGVKAAFVLLGNSDVAQRAIQTMISPDAPMAAVANPQAGNPQAASLPPPQQQPPAGSITQPLVQGAAPPPPQGQQPPPQGAAPPQQQGAAPPAGTINNPAQAAAGSTITVSVGGMGQGQPAPEGQAPPPPPPQGQLAAPQGQPQTGSTITSTVAPRKKRKRSFYQGLVQSVRRQAAPAQQLPAPQQQQQQPPPSSTSPAAPGTTLDTNATLTAIANSLNISTVNGLVQRGVSALGCVGVGGLVQVGLGLVETKTIKLNLDPNNLPQIPINASFKIQNDGHTFLIDTSKPTLQSVSVDGIGVMKFAALLISHDVVVFVAAALYFILPGSMITETARDIVVLIGRPDKLKFANPFVWGSQIMVPVFVIVGVATGAVAAGSSGHFRTAHEVLGWLTLILVVANFGMHLLMVRNPTSKPIQRTRAAVAVLTLAFGQVDLITGFVDLNAVSLCIFEALPLPSALSIGAFLTSNFSLAFGALAMRFVVFKWLDSRMLGEYAPTPASSALGRYADEKKMALADVSEVSRGPSPTDMKGAAEGGGGAGGGPRLINAPIASSFMD
ncbi:hypothetical protein IWZ03DRAFT_409223 [Phyllosticta citriasiana]|uniref:Uncharacterized protein n=1 Tax=Phyllosticta citriasiana TaxID=595635 RepID=A0ABR1KDN9_9PEZI